MACLACETSPDIEVELIAQAMSMITRYHILRKVEPALPCRARKVLLAGFSLASLLLAVGGEEQCRDDSRSMLVLPCPDTSHVLTC